MRWRPSTTLEHRSAGVLALVMALCVTGTVPASAGMVLRVEAPATTPDPEAAQRALDEAERAADREDLLGVAKALEQAYRFDPQPRYLYMRANVLREAGSCRAAIAVFEEYLEVATTPEDAREWIEQCEQVVASEPEVEPEVETEETEPVAAPVDDDPSVSDERRGPDPWGVVGLGVGGAVALGGGIVLGTSYGLARNPQGETETDYEDRDRRTRVRAVSGVALISIGAAVMVAGGIRLGLVSKRRRSAMARRVQPSLGGMIVRF